MNDLLKWISADRFRVACVSFVLGVGLFAGFNFLSRSCEAVMQHETERRKWRAVESESFWKQRE